MHKPVQQSRQQAQIAYCPNIYTVVKGCPETNDLISDKESGGLTDTTKNLIQRILDERSCGEKSDGMYCCAKEPVAKINETECKFFAIFRQPHKHSI